MEKLLTLFLKDKKNLKLRNEIIKNYKELVWKIVHSYKYYPKVLEKQDLFQEGILGLMKALERYENMGFSFINYVIDIIKFEIRELIRKSHTPSIPERKIKEERKLDNEELMEETIPLTFSKVLNPHQYWLRAVKHEFFMKKLKKNLSDTEFKIICLAFGIISGNINHDYQPSYSNSDISKMLILTKTQVKRIKNKTLTKLKKIFKKKNKK
ncbi:sigma-70 family RNA polymerase sigma factor [Candidatus Phytoplasma australasiaticum]|uniref:sigma-70 family RNA polymerase sigma factor n=1 Tax=Candidatus Phytoplasma australasiaticum TaxID=2754999 RepID=UPI002713E71A|nr:sigma-70 family RNA polymerase sigma factor [Candidatus Phytoplasma australasiaticum]MDO8059830.1 sigma-70 family RNA polymerase sigma factor [Candidatus Phytoplasma australasiaticum]